MLYLANDVKRWGHAGDFDFAAMNGWAMVSAPWARQLLVPTPGYGFVDETPPAIWLHTRVGFELVARTGELLIMLRRREDFSA